MEDLLNKGFKSLRHEVGLLKHDMQEIGSQVVNLCTSVNILTNMQGVLVEKVVDYKIKENSTKVLASKANNHSKSFNGTF